MKNTIEKVKASDKLREDMHVQNACKELLQVNKKKSKKSNLKMRKGHKMGRSQKSQNGKLRRDAQTTSEEA